MKDKIARITKKLSTWKTASSVFLWAILGIVTVAGVITVYAQMPKKVEDISKKVEIVDKKVDEKAAEADEKIVETKGNVEKLAGTVDKYIALQVEQQKSQEKREELMLMLIEQKQDK